MSRWLKQLLEVYTWLEFWILVGATASIAGVWYLFSNLLQIRDVGLRAALIWSLIILLSLGSATTEFLMKREE